MTTKSASFIPCMVPDEDSSPNFNSSREDAGMNTLGSAREDDVAEVGFKVVEAEVTQLGDLCTSVLSSSPSLYISMSVPNFYIKRKDNRSPSAYDDDGTFSFVTTPALAPSVPLFA